MKKFNRSPQHLPASKIFASQWLTIHQTFVRDVFFIPSKHHFSFSWPQNTTTPSLKKILTVSTDPTKMHPCKEERWLIISPEFFRDVISIPLNINLALKQNNAQFEKHINCFHRSNKDAPLQRKIVANYLPRVCS